MFSNLRTRYSKDKKRIKEKKVSGTSRDDVNEEKGEPSELFSYLTWLDEYVHPRRSKSNMNHEESPEGGQDDKASDSE